MIELISIFIIGLIFGSFLNVVIYRLNPALQLKSGVFGRSVCLHCKTQLRWYDLIPILSFIYLRGKCRYCDKKISWQYLIVEILSGLIWIGVFYKVYGFMFQFFPTFQLGSSISQPNLGNLGEIGTIFNFIYYIFIFSSLLVIAVYDFKWKIIPDKIVYPAIAIALIYNFLKSSNFKIFKFFQPEAGPPLAENFETFIWSLFAALIAFSFFFLIYFFSRGKAMGFGDAKLAFLICLFLGPALTIVALTTTFTIGAVFGIILIVASKIPNPWFYRRWGMKSQIAFGPLLVFGAVIAFFFSNFIYKFLNF